MLLWNKNEREKNIATKRSEHSQPQETASRNDISHWRLCATENEVHATVLYRRSFGRKPKQRNLSNLIGVDREQQIVYDILWLREHAWGIATGPSANCTIDNREMYVSSIISHFSARR